MWKMIGNIVEMFMYGSVYMIICLIAVKIAAASLSADFEKRVSENSLAFGLVFAAIFVGLAIVLSSVMR
jgi:hypothetical protein